jgi:hypothetical protein
MARHVVWNVLVVLQCCMPDIMMGMLSFKVSGCPTAAPLLHPLQLLKCFVFCLLWLVAGSQLAYGP